MKQRPVAECDAALRKHHETNHFYDEKTGELYEPKVGEMPDDPTPTRPQRQPPVVAKLPAHG